ncbi:hypothetical protein Tco_0631069 [Tanacetum coccineum]
MKKTQRAMDSLRLEYRGEYLKLIDLGIEGQNEMQIPSSVSYRFGLISFIWSKDEMVRVCDFRCEQVEAVERSEQGAIGSAPGDGILIVNVLLSLLDTNVNALTRDHKVALDIAEGLSLSEESTDIRRACRILRGAVRTNKLNQQETIVVFAAIFIICGVDSNDGMAAVVHRTSFKIFNFNGIAFFTYVYPRFGDFCLASLCQRN